jgi:hypothetical protein
MNPSYDDLLKEIESLKQQLSENVVISSMNDMKNQYNNLKNSTIPIYKYNELSTKYNIKSSKVTTTIVILDHILKNTFISDKIKLELLFLKELLID